MWGLSQQVYPEASEEVGPDGHRFRSGQSYRVRGVGNNVPNLQRRYPENGQPAGGRSLPHPSQNQETGQSWGRDLTMEPERGCTNQESVLRRHGQCQMEDGAFTEPRLISKDKQEPSTIADIPRSSASQRGTPFLRR